MYVYGCLEHVQAHIVLGTFVHMHPDATPEKRSVSAMKIPSALLKNVDTTRCARRHSTKFFNSNMQLCGIYYCECHVQFAPDSSSSKLCQTPMPNLAPRGKMLVFSYQTPPATLEEISPVLSNFEPDNAIIGMEISSGETDSTSPSSIFHKVTIEHLIQPRVASGSAGTTFSPCISTVVIFGHR